MSQHGGAAGLLAVARRAASLRTELSADDDPMGWVTLSALAGNEENAAEIATMRDTGKDMKTKYKETARGLAGNIIEC